MFSEWKTAKLDNRSESQWDRPPIHVEAATGQIRALINQVDAFSGKAIHTETAKSLRGQLEDLLALL